MCTAINYLYNGMLLRLKKILYLASPEYHEMLFVQKCFLWKQFLLTFKSHTISWHSTDILFFYHINILLLIDAVDNRNKTKPRKFFGLSWYCNNRYKFKNNKNFRWHSFRLKRWKAQMNTILIRYSCISLFKK